MKESSVFTPGGVLEPEADGCGGGGGGLNGVWLGCDGADAIADFCSGVSGAVAPGTEALCRKSSILSLYASLSSPTSFLPSLSPHCQPPGSEVLFSVYDQTIPLNLLFRLALQLVLVFCQNALLGTVSGEVAHIVDLGPSSVGEARDGQWPREEVPNSGNPRRSHDGSRGVVGGLREASRKRSQDDDV